jgi:hypothetical protein
VIENEHFGLVFACKFGYCSFVMYRVRLHTGSRSGSRRIGWYLRVFSPILDSGYRGSDSEFSVVPILVITGNKFSNYFVHFFIFSGMSALQASRKYGVPSRTLYDKVRYLVYLNFVIPLRKFPKFV